MRARILIVLIGALILSGCAANDQIIKNYHNDYVSDFSGYSNLLLEPVDTVGILETPFLREGKTRFYEVSFPEILFLGEIFPGRMKWFGWIVDEKGNESLAQLLWIYRVKLSGNLVGVIAVEGDEQKMLNPKVVGLSTRFRFTYALDETEKEIPINRDEFVKSAEYRKKIVAEHGIPLSGLEKADYMYDIINKWNRVEGPRGYTLTPLNKESFLYVAEINPAYSYSQKFVEYASGTIIPLDPVATGMSLFFDLVKPLHMPAKGWDLDNRSDRRTYSVVAKHLIDVKYAAIKEILKDIRKEMPK